MAAVEGSENLIRVLQALGKKARGCIRKGARKGAKVIAPAAKALAPRRSGALAAAIKVRALKRSRRWVGAQVTARVAGGEVGYGGFVELGAKRQKAQHYLKRAEEGARAAAGSAFVAGITQEMARVIGH